MAGNVDARRDDFEGATVRMDDHPTGEIDADGVHTTERAYRDEPIPAREVAPYEDGACYVWEGGKMRRAASADHLRALPAMYHAGDVLRVVGTPDGQVTAHVDMRRAELCASKAGEAADALLDGLLIGAADVRLVRAVVGYVAVNAGRALAAMLGEAAS